jgi:hypothetical protein
MEAFRKRGRSLLIVLLGALMVYALAACQTDTHDTPPVAKFDFPVRSLEEKATSITSIRDGKPAVVEFWGVT